MKRPSRRSTQMKWLGIVLMCIAFCVVYGVIHDQVTARICVEYFTIGHPAIFATDDPTLLGLGWGFVATWWVGLLLGVPLASACRWGRWPRREPRTLWRLLFRLALFSFANAAVAGLVGWWLASRGWVQLLPPLADRVPPERHVPFLIALWAHNASYLTGFVGGFVIILLILRDRYRNRSLQAEDV